MSRRDISIGLDIGTSSVKAVAVGRQDSHSAPQIVGSGFSLSVGIRRGMIVDIEAVTKSIERALLDLFKNTGFRSKKVFINLAGWHIGTLTSRGTVAVSRADGEIVQEDVDRVIAESQKISVPANREIIHVVPKNFTVDEERGIKNPQGMHGIRLEVESLLVLASTPAIKNLMKCLRLLDLEPEGLIVSPIVSAEIILTAQDKELGAVSIDIGAGTTNLAVFEEGGLIHLAILPIGSLCITNDIAIGLQVPIDLAEKIKIEYGVSAASQVEGKKNTINLSKISTIERGMFSQRDVAEIIEARLSEIFDLINRELKKIGRQNLLPAGAVLTGGGSKLSGIIELAKKELRLPVRLACVEPTKGLIKPILAVSMNEEAEDLTGNEAGIIQYNDPSFSCARGLAFWKWKLFDGGLGKKIINFPVPMRIISEKIKNLFKNFLP